MNVHPRASLDARNRRVLDKELRAALGENRSRWLSSPAPVDDKDPILVLSCQAAETAIAIALSVRMGLAHLIPGVRRRLPDWNIQFTARGSDGALQLGWGLDLGPRDVVDSLAGHVPRRQIHESAGRQYWDERDGGIALLHLGAWTWNAASREWSEWDYRPG